jgi:hypothetical protein
MASRLVPLQHDDRIVNDDGSPTPYFIQLFQQFLEEKAATDALAEGAVPVTRLINTTNGITGGGDLTADLTLEAEVQAILDQISTTEGDVLYRGSADWVALAPGTDGDVLTTHGAGAAPTWEAPAAGGSGSPWALVASSSPSGVNSHDFTGLGAYTDLMLIGSGVTGSVNSFRGVLLSVDNGATFANTGYSRIGVNGAVTNQTELDGTTTADAAARSFVVAVYGANVNAAPKYCFSSAGFSTLFVNSLAPVNALRYYHSSGGNITGGTLYLFGR